MPIGDSPFAPRFDACLIAGTLRSLFDQIWQWDQDLYHALHVGVRSAALDPWMKLVTDTGLGWVQALILGIVLWARQTWRPSVLLVFGSAVFCGLVRLPAMRWFDRMRPSNFEFASPMEDIFGNSSFPSGHTATSFAIAFSVWFLVKGTRYAWLGPALTAWALAVGISRIYVGVHYPSDVLGGAGFALMTSAAFFLILERLRKGSEPALDQSDQSESEEVSSSPSK